ncbi:MAG: phosphatase PAP2 family protein [Sphingobacteriales bacterium]|nr:MAG: phosphatase PAP2 family protein [Sphingobacteriales bacterium]
MLKRLLFVLMVACTDNACAQVHINKDLDSLKSHYDTVAQVNDTRSEAYTETTRITFPIYFKLLWSDLKQQVTAPIRGNKQDWIRFGGLVAGTAVLSFADEPLQEKALEWRNNSSTVRTVSRQVTHLGANYETYTLISLGVYGFVFKNEKVKTTTLLATQSYITSAVIMAVIKNTAGRQRPDYIDPATGKAASKFHGPSLNHSDEFKSFPSGHTTAAFAAATVYAMEYRKSIIVPIVAYSAASLVGISRVTENKHWATDALIGATIGYLCGRVVVNNYHRFAKLMNARKLKGTASVTVNYSYGVLQPGIIYRF